MSIQADPRVSRFSDDSEQSQSIGDLLSPSPSQHQAEDTISRVLADTKAKQDIYAIQAYADYVVSYNEWKVWVSNLSSCEDRLENISLQLEHLDGDLVQQEKNFQNWRRERLRCHDLTRLTYTALHKCAFCMTEYHNILTEIYNETDFEVDTLKKKLQEANGMIRELSTKLEVVSEQSKNTATQVEALEDNNIIKELSVKLTEDEVERLEGELKEANSAIEELATKLKQAHGQTKDYIGRMETANDTLEQSQHSPLALTESWGSVETDFVEIFI